MNRLFIITLCVITLLSFQSPLFAHPSGINLLSQSHRVWGGTFPDNYDLTGPASVTGTSPLTYCQAGNYSVNASSSGNTLINLQGAHAISSYLFLIENDILQIKLDGNIWCSEPDTGISYRLTDKTAGTTLDSFAYSGHNWTPPISGNSYCSYDNSLNCLDKSHLYELYLCADASCGDGGTAALNANLSSVCQVPAPSAMLLGSVGTAIAALLKRRK